MINFTTAAIVVVACLAVIGLVGLNGHSMKRFGYSGFSRLNMGLASGSVAAYFLADWVRGSSGLEHREIYLIAAYITSFGLIAAVVARNMTNTNRVYGLLISTLQIPVLLAGGIIVVAIVLTWIAFSALALVLGDGADDQAERRAAWKKRQAWYLNEVNPLGPNGER